jgi:hypothetical protein
MEMQGDLKKAYESSVSMSWAMIAALVLCPLIVEIVRMSNAAFAGFAPYAANQIRDPVYGLAIILPLCIRTIRKLILKRGQASDWKALASRLRAATAVTILIAEMPAMLGLLLFLLAGFYREFYIALAYSLLVVLAYFPRFNRWEKSLTF